MHQRVAVLWLAGVVQATIAMDSTIMNVALPAVQAELGVADAARHWVVSAFALAFGAFLLPASRLVARIGMRRAVLAGAVIFAAASITGAVAPTLDVLLVGRALQGVAAALLAPAALSMVQDAFPSGPPRRRAFGVYGAIGVAGTAVGLVLGGPLTELLSWRATLILLLLLALIVAVGAILIRLGPLPPAQRRIPVLGTALSASGVLAVVMALSLLAEGPHVASVPLGALGVALLVGFGLAQRHEADPLIPPSLVAVPGRVASLGVLGLGSAGLFSVFLFVVFFLQGSLEMSAAETSLAILPFPVVATSSSVLLAPALSRVLGTRAALTIAAGLGAVGMGWLAAGAASATYAHTVFPAVVLTATGMGIIFAIAPDTALADLKPRDRDAGASLVHVVQQVGGALGVTGLTLVAGSQQAPAGSYQLVFAATAAVFVLAAAVAATASSPRHIGATSALQR